MFYGVLLHFICILLVLPLLYWTTCPFIVWNLSDPKDPPFGMKHETPKSPQYSGSIQLTLNVTADNTVNNNDTFFLLFDVQVLALGHVLPLVTYTIIIFYDLNFRLICSFLFVCFLSFACYVIILVYNMVNIVPIKSAVLACFHQLYIHFGQNILCSQ